ncbi:PREDICTED: cyclin-D-binding Myb-like transcription factor 1 [Thamnophis sirtalis]|uniref:Cyclin-D-binding Myb-like transcription factor 1 n=1 Tax=Thamnophis sirtalis TaxID=35019 RepID=A0A6I9YS98_9SAUR|nr:PREDICTED: cyclin-D-binding Myb-like transcription factor 1 [Thamnophis sirtalis]
MWSKEEIQILMSNIERYLKARGIKDATEIIFEMSKDERKDFYRTIAWGLNRPLFAVYRRVLRMYDDRNHVGKYTPEEIEKLKELRIKHGNDWATIGAALGRSASSVKDRCRLMKDTCNTGKWTEKEERRLAEVVHEMTSTEPGDIVTQGVSWAAVAERVGTRSEKQCRSKWLNYLNWKQSGGTEWTKEDEINLILRIAELEVADENGINWDLLAEGWSSVRSPQWLRSKWWTIKRQIANHKEVSFPGKVTLGLIPGFLSDRRVQFSSYFIVLCACFTGTLPPSESAPGPALDQAQWHSNGVRFCPFCAWVRIQDYVPASYGACAASAKHLERARMPSARGGCPAPSQRDPELTTREFGSTRGNRLRNNPLLSFLFLDPILQHHGENSHLIGSSLDSPSSEDSKGMENLVSCH